MKTGMLCSLAVVLFLAVFPAHSALPYEHMDWWRAARFGMFVHWGPVSLKGTEIGWSRGGERRGREGTGEIPVDVYDNLYKEFNPVKFDAAEWAQIAKDAGMKYLVFTSKHHDGFCMFDSALTEYKIANSPFKRDVVGELADAFRDAGLKVGYYYSPVDWHHPDYRTEFHGRYIQYLHGQLRELCTNYGKIDIIWFDGLGGTAQDWDSERLLLMIRQLQPGIIINNRAGLPADHDTPEQRVGAFNRKRPWETCMTICRQWAWKPNDKLKSLDECIDVLVRTVGGDGNLLLNVGPMPDGRIEPRQAERLAEIGDWLDEYGITIYGSRGGPYVPCAWGATTCKLDRVYVHVLDWEKAKDGQIVLPPLGRKIIGQAVMTGGQAAVRQDDNGVYIQVEPEARKEPDTIVALQIEGAAEDIDPLSFPSQVVEGEYAASNVYMDNKMFVPAHAFDDDPETRWATDPGTSQAWIQVNLSKPKRISEVLISEAFPERIQKFELQKSDDGQKWETFYEGKTVGHNGRARFKPLTVKNLRLNILEAFDGPTIWEIKLKED